MKNLRKVLQMCDLQKLKEPFPKDEIEWRSQTLTRDGEKALALAYIQRKHVIHRLNEVCGVDGWQSSFTETAKGRIICTISINVGGNWVSKSDGAGDTQVEAEKGAISDAFKRAASMWGIGLYLYDVDAPWVPCETYERNGKKYFSKWKVDPWTCVKNQPAPRITKEKIADAAEKKAQAHKAKSEQFAKDFTAQIATADSMKALQKMIDEKRTSLDWIKANFPEVDADIQKEVDKEMKRIGDYIDA